MTANASFEDVPAIRGLVAAAYHDDPLTAWLFPDPDTRPHACGAWYGLFAEQYVAIGRASVLFVGDELAAVGLWRLPDDAPLSSDGVPGIAGLMSALLGSARAAEVGHALHAISSVQSAEPQAYLNFLAVAPSHRRAGLGRRVLEPLFAAADDAGLPVGLETTNPANYPFYDALGFAEVGRLQLASGGPLLRVLSLVTSSR